MTTIQIRHRPTTPRAAGVEIAVLRPGDDLLRWVAERHRRDLPHGLFPRLGARFVRRWHRAHLESPHGVGLVALRGGEPIGFLLGATDRPANVAWLLTHRRGPLARSAAAALLVRPRVLAEFVSTRASRYARRLSHRTPVTTTAGTGSDAGPVPVAVLEAVVVLDHERGHGVGTRLVEEFVAAARRAGATRAELVTKAGPTGASGFYRRRSWQQVGSHSDRDGDVVETFAAEL